MTYPNATYSGAIISSIENKDVTWEKNGNVNVGVEFKALGRLGGTVEWYRRTTTDMLLEYPVAISLGFPGYYANVGKMYNTGLDMTFGYDILNAPDLFWNVSLMASTVGNKVVSLTGNGEDINNGVYLIREGETVNTFYMARSGCRSGYRRAALSGLRQGRGRQPGQGQRVRDQRRDNSVRMQMALRQQIA